ncbi:hypothetical protein CDAR_475911 [Caerostris darwini]|uniref:Uncharacterized protein n=1 Tax=Caerostris darwini TaxID=1538125 RepID=A0AAV4PBY8_9ARAC|nr:hypothetical protein CDAR_475911 [Caerostris darwini]
MENRLASSNVIFWLAIYHPKTLKRGTLLSGTARQLFVLIRSPGHQAAPPSSPPDPSQILPSELSTTSQSCRPRKLENSFRNHAAFLEPFLHPRTHLPTSVR